MDIFFNLLKNRRTNPLNMAMAVSISAILAVGCASVPPPKDQMAVSKAEVIRASRNGGNEYSPIETKSAMEKMDGAEQAMMKEDYPLAKRLAEQAQVDARLAETKTALAKAQKAVVDSQESNDVLREEIRRATP